MDIPSGSTLFWHRRDLRLVDNVGLKAATSSSPVVPLYCLDPTLLSLAGARRRDFFVSALADLKTRYRDRGSDLLVVRGEPTDEVPATAVSLEADSIGWNRDHSRYAIERDRVIIDELEDEGMTVTESRDMTLHEPGSIRTSDGNHYSVFSYYYDKWKTREAAEPVSGPDRSSLATFSAPDVRSVIEAELEDVTDPLAADREAAESRLEGFLEGPIYDYGAQRDYPAASGTSRISQDLKFGLLGIREVVEGIRGALQEAETDADRENVEEFLRQVAWRDFYVQVLAAHPDTVWQNFTDFAEPIDWRFDPEEFRAWKRGETGYPIVDAGMRQLLETGFVHNRVRMIAASFLTKDLQIDWRKGYQWYREHLIDHDTASDVGGWQWAASTGPNSQPYFRVFNPTTQGKRYDPDAEYIKSHVPELAGVQPKEIHRWTDIDSDRRAALAPDYPDPIVDHAERRDSAIEMFERAQGK